MEIWRDIDGYEGVYQVSNHGRVRSFRNNKHKLKDKPHLMKLSNHGKGYKRVGLCGNSKSKTYSVHRLVAQAFIKNPEGKEQVNHKDGDKKNNFASNLEWVTVRENIDHAWQLGLNEINIKKRLRPIGRYDLVGHLIETYISAAEAGRIHGFYSPDLGRCALGHRKTAHGFIWRFLSIDDSDFELYSDEVKEILVLNREKVYK